MTKKVKQIGRICPVWDLHFFRFAIIRKNEIDTLLLGKWNRDVSGKKEIENGMKRTDRNSTGVGRPVLCCDGKWTGGSVYCPCGFGKRASRRRFCWPDGRYGSGLPTRQILRCQRGQRIGTFCCWINSRRSRNRPDQQALCTLIRENPEQALRPVSRGTAPGWLISFQFAGLVQIFNAQSLPAGSGNR